MNIENLSEEDKKRLREQARNKYRHLSEEDKKKKREYGKNRYYNMPEQKKQKLKDYQENIVKQKSLSIIMSKLFFTINIRFGLIIRVTI